MSTWQVKLGAITPAPFVRARYHVAVKAILCKFAENQIPSVFHVITKPKCEDGKFWIGSSPCGNILKTFINDVGKKTVGFYFHPREYEYITLNFLENWSLQIIVIDEDGKSIECSGYCIMKIEEI